MSARTRFAAAALTTVLAVEAGGAEPARVESFSPEGTAKQVSQVSAVFSEAMVPFGDPARAVSPFVIDCPARASARWVDERSFAIDFVEPLPGGLRCRFELVAGLETLAGRPVEGRRAFSFDTGGPAIVEPTPFAGAEIVDDQVFLLRLDAAANEASVGEHVFFSVTGIQEPIGVRLLAPAEREEVLSTLSAEARREPHVVLRARQRFPAEADVVLHWGPGISTPSGVETHEAQTFPFKVRPPLRASVLCGRERPKADCVPITPIRIAFSAPVPWAVASRIALVREGTGPGPGRVEARRAFEGDADPLVERIVFRGPFAPQARYRLEIPDDLRDDAGRSLSAPAPADRFVRTAGYPPLAKFPASFGIVELRADPALPVTLRALEPEVRAKLLGPAAGKLLPARAVRVAAPTGAELLGWLRDLEATSETKPLLPAGAKGIRKIALPLAPAPASGDSEVVGIPLPGPGLHLVEIESRVLGDRLLDPPGPMFVSAGALVTDLAVHLLWGRESSLVFVTSLEKADPVAGAKVVIVDCRGKTRFEGTTDETGVVRTEGLPHEGAVERCEGPAGRWSAYDTGLLVLASKSGDTGIVHSSWNRGIEPWRFRIPTAWWGESPLVAHTVFARTLLRAGETVHMKHVLRRPAMEGFALPKPAELPDEVVIRHEATGQETPLAVRFGADGTALSEWRIPPSSRLGSFSVSLRRKQPGAGGELSAGSFRVEAFRLPFMRAALQVPASPQVAVAEVPVDVAVTYLSGGAAAKLPVQVRGEIRPRANLAFEDAPGFEGFFFARGPVAVGVRKDGADAPCDGADCPPDADSPTRLEARSLVLDAAGTGRVELPVSIAPLPRNLAVEVEYRDPAGVVQTAAASVPLWPASRVVGLRVEGSAAKPDVVRAAALVVDLGGRPMADARVSIDAFERKIYTHRRRLVGGFYAYTNIEETLALGRFCEGTTDSIGRFSCEASVSVSGNVLLEARSTDANGRIAITQDETWIAGEGSQWFEPSDDDRIDLLAEKRRYEPGEMARFQVRMPFPEATALVTVERSGVGEHFVRRLSGRDPIVEIPVRAANAPNVFVSVLAVRGRVSGVKPTGRIDLGRPAFRLGIAEIEVGTRSSRLEVQVRPERGVYRVREKAILDVNVTAESGVPLPPGSEIAVAAVDEALLELVANDSFDLLAAMMGRRSYEVSTATSQGLVIGKRHFGLKALVQGGGGGRKPTRELFDTLLTWQGRVALDAKGHARVEVPLNDSLSSFRIAVAANAGTGLFGDGWATIRTTQDLMVLPGLPPLVREGDSFRAHFTLRNTTSKGLGVKVVPQVTGLAAQPAPLDRKLDAGEAFEAGFEVKVPAGIDHLDWEVALIAGGREMDRLRLSQRVVPAVPVRVFQGTIARLDPSLEVPVEKPAGALAGRGGVEVGVQAKLGDGLEGVSDWLRRYPFGCLEQKISIAIGTRDAEAWRALSDELPGFLDDDGLAKFFPGMSAGSPVLSAYLLSIAHEAGREIPETSKKALLDGLDRFARGQITRQSIVPAPDDPLRRVSVLDALSRHGRLDAELVSSVTPLVDLWPTSTLLDWIGVLRRTPAIPGAASKLDAARRALRARLVLQGTTLGFSTQSRDELPWLLASPDANAARVVLEGLSQKSPAQEMARLVRGALGRQVGARWDSTFADAWGVVALDRFSKTFEKENVTGAVEATLGSVTRRLVFEKGKGTAASRFEWPTAKTTLALRRSGTGAPWATVRSLAAVPLVAPISSGFALSRRVEPLVQRTKGRTSRGDIVKVVLEGESQTDQAWVAVRDPIPAGAQILGAGLGGGSLLADAAAAAPRCPCPASTERSFEAFTQFYEWMPQGRFELSYVLVLNQDGVFELPPSRVEAMYAPETFAEVPIAPLAVEP